MFIVYFGLFASLGALLRYFMQPLAIHSFSVGNLLANTLGSFLLGMLASGVLDKYFVGIPKAVIAVAFLGALTTFSSYSLEVVEFLRQDRWSQALICIICHNLLSISACYIALKYFSPSAA
jgi:CrcB protein